MHVRLNVQCNGTTILSPSILMYPPIMLLKPFDVSCYWSFNLYLVVDTCPVPQLENGQINYNGSQVAEGYPLSTMANFTCSNGYSLSGPNSSTCQISRSWTQLPTCNLSKK